MQILLVLDNCHLNQDYLCCGPHIWHNHFIDHCSSIQPMIEAVAGNYQGGCIFLVVATFVDKLNWQHLSDKGTTHYCSDLSLVIMTSHWYPFYPWSTIWNHAVSQSDPNSKSGQQALHVAPQLPAVHQEIPFEFLLKSCDGVAIFINGLVHHFSCQSYCKKVTPA